MEEAGANRSNIWKGGVAGVGGGGERDTTHLLMLPHEVLDVSVLALLSLMDLLLAPQLSIIPQSLKKEHTIQSTLSVTPPTAHLQGVMLPSIALILQAPSGLVDPNHHLLEPARPARTLTKHCAAG